MKTIAFPIAAAMLIASSSAVLAHSNDAASTKSSELIEAGLARKSAPDFVVAKNGNDDGADHDAGDDYGGR